MIKVTNRSVEGLNELLLSNDEMLLLYADLAARCDAARDMGDVVTSARLMKWLGELKK